MHVKGRCFQKNKLLFLLIPEEVIYLWSVVCLLCMPFVVLLAIACSVLLVMPSLQRVPFGKPWILPATTNLITCVLFSTSTAWDRVAPPCFSMILIITRIGLKPLGKRQDLCAFSYALPFCIMIVCVSYQIQIPDFPFCNINWQHNLPIIFQHIFTGIVLSDLSDHFSIWRTLFCDEVLPHKGETIWTNSMNVILPDWLKLLNAYDTNDYPTVDS